MHIIKRSVRISGHTTSVSLEEPFWRELHNIANSRNIPVAKIIAEIDENRSTNLSSALRVFILEDVLKRSAPVSG